MPAPLPTPATALPWARRVVAHELAIAAPADRVWSLVSTPARYGEWNPFIPRIDAPDGLAPGAELLLHVDMGRFRTTSPERVLRCEAPAGDAPGALVYVLSGRMGRLGLVRAERHQYVVPTGPASCRWHSFEGFAGRLWRLLPYGGIEAGFHTHAAALKRAAEAPAG